LSRLIELRLSACQSALQVRNALRQQVSLLLAEPLVHAGLGQLGAKRGLCFCSLTLQLSQALFLLGKLCLLRPHLKS
jgi:hypothetical protein